MVVCHLVFSTNFHLLIFHRIVAYVLICTYMNLVQSLQILSISLYLAESSVHHIFYLIFRMQTSSRPAYSQNVSTNFNQFELDY